MYSPVLVSIRISSPSSINKGTLISAPVSKVAGFNVFVAVLPLKPGSVFVTFKTTKFGGSIPKILPLYEEP